MTGSSLVSGRAPQVAAYPPAALQLAVVVERHLVGAEHVGGARDALQLADAELAALLFAALCLVGASFAAYLLAGAFLPAAFLVVVFFAVESAIALPSDLLAGHQPVDELVLASGRLFVGEVS